MGLRQSDMNALLGTGAQHGSGNRLQEELLCFATELFSYRLGPWAHTQVSTRGTAADDCFLVDALQSSRAQQDGWESVRKSSSVVETGKLQLVSPVGQAGVVLLTAE